MCPVTFNIRKIPEDDKKDVSLFLLPMIDSKAKSSKTFQATQKKINTKRTFGGTRSASSFAFLRIGNLERNDCNWEEAIHPRPPEDAAFDRDRLGQPDFTYNGGSILFNDFSS
mmetsp:Transcript_14043/g.39337  ORF Transcript_14043/g.39337 Transcript_14043/m.39337 type:complete len:113 (-) Transcript_14043:287-625(-)